MSEADAASFEIVFGVVGKGACTDNAGNEFFDFFGLFHDADGFGDFLGVS